MSKQAVTRTTELEAGVLGVIWRHGPCTPYAVRKHFLESPAPRWSGSAGAIYPLIRRLETRDLVKSRASARGKRVQRDYRITPAGRAALRRWLRAPIAHTEATLIHDPLRARMLFLEALPMKEARSFVSDALQSLRQTLGETQAECRANPIGQDCFAHFAARNALILTRARVSWLAEVQIGLAEAAKRRSDGATKGTTRRM